MSIISHIEPWRFCLAPMMRRTDTHFRHLISLLAPNMRLYTEMLTPNALIFGDRNKLLAFSTNQSPLALQLGGSDPKALLESAYIAIDYGYTEINLNCGCPSDRVQAGQFGASLMKKPKLISSCVRLLSQKLPKNIEVTVKTRLGIDNIYRYDYLKNFIERLIQNGVNIFHVHARKALLKGLSPKENREIPPLNYGWVHRLKDDFPDSIFVLNGGLTNLEQIKVQLDKIDGVMIGRHAYTEPYSLMEFNSELFTNSPKRLSRLEIATQYIHYMEQQLSEGVALSSMSRHAINLFHGEPNSKAWRQALTMPPRGKKLKINDIVGALESVAAT
jgi:tRNA-dihydrouridine synthase A